MNGSKNETISINVFCQRPRQVIVGGGTTSYQRRLLGDIEESEWSPLGKTVPIFRVQTSVDGVDPDKQVVWLHKHFG